jgi:hypothetical protein
VHSTVDVSMTYPKHITKPRENTESKPSTVIHIYTEDRLEELWYKASQAKMFTRPKVIGQS